MIIQCLCKIDYFNIGSKMWFKIWNRQNSLFCYKIEELTQHRMKYIEIPLHTGVFTEELTSLKIY